MTYYKAVSNSYIVGVSTGCGQVRITKQQYDELMEIISSKPADPEGYCYMLRDADLTWEMVELPPAPEPDPDAEISDYENALADLGVRLE